MIASRFNRKSRERLLYIASGLVTLVVISFILWIIPQAVNDPTPGKSPEITTPSFLVLFAIHLGILAMLVWEVWLSRRGRPLQKIMLIIPGIILILVSIFLVDASRAYMENQPGMFSMAIPLFIAAVFNMITGIITIMLPIRFPGHQQDNDNSQS